jgi:hypothetical protein
MGVLVSRFCTKVYGDECFGLGQARRYIYIYLGLGSYRLTIKERNGGVWIRGKNRVVDESTSCVANMNCEGFYDGETELL